MPFNKKNLRKKYKITKDLTVLSKKLKYISKKHRKRIIHLYQTHKLLFSRLINKQVMMHHEINYLFIDIGSRNQARL